MFLAKLKETDPLLIETAVSLHQQGKLLPDTYAVDVDAFLDNAKAIKEAADAQHIHLYYMLKQIGRNPWLAQQLEDLGYEGAVAVDWKECQVLMKHHLHLSHAGHLVQIPSAMVKEIVAYGCDYITVYSLKKIQEIEEAAASLNKIQKIMIRVIGPEDLIYSGQTAGFYLDELKATGEYARKCPHVQIAGVTSFPCFLFDETTQDMEPQPNLKTVLKAKEMLEGMGFVIENVNAPSATCVRTIEKMQGYGINSAEPGHGLSGTTPLHAVKNCKEIPCVCYVSEVSHNLDGKAYCFGGGYYRRGHLRHALVGSGDSDMKETLVTPPNLDSIDYHFMLDEAFPEGDAVIMSFRYQVFVTRSDVCLIQGIHTGKPEIAGIYSALGEKKA